MLLWRKTPDAFHVVATCFSCCGFCWILWNFVEIRGKQGCRRVAHQCRVRGRAHSSASLTVVRPRLLRASPRDPARRASLDVLYFQGWLMRYLSANGLAGGPCGIRNNARAELARRLDKIEVAGVCADAAVEKRRVR